MNRRRGALFWPAVLSVVLVSVTALVLSLAPLRTDLAVIAPETQSEELDFLFRSLREGPASRIVLVSVGREDGQSLAEPAALSRALKEAFQESGQFESVANGTVAWSRASLEPFFKHRYLMNPELDPEYFSPEKLRLALMDLLRSLQGLSAPIIEDIMVEDPTLRALEVARLWIPNSKRQKQQGVWADPTTNGVLFIVTTKADAFDLGAQERALEAISASVTELEPTFGALRSEVSGPSVIAVESRRAAEADSLRLMLLSTLAVAVLLLAFFRHTLVYAATVTVLSAAFLTGTLVVIVAFGEIHVTTLGFGATLVGIAVDYPLHLLARAGSGRSTLDAARRIWPALRLGVLTTLVGLVPLVVSNFPGIAQLGAFTVSGLATAAVMTRWILPLVMPRAPLVPDSSFWGPIEALRKRLTQGRWLAAALGAGAACGLLVAGPHVWQTDLESLSPIPQDLRARDQALRAQLDVPSPRHMIVVDGSSIEDVLQRSESLLPYLEAAKSEGRLADFALAARYIPSAQRQVQRQSTLPEPNELRANLRASLEGLPFRPGVFEPFVEAVGAAKTAPPLRPDQLEPEELRSRVASLLISTGGSAYRGIGLMYGLNDPKATLRSIQGVSLPGVSLLDFKGATQRLMESYRREALVWTMIGAAAALLVVVFAVRRMRDIVGIAAPVSISVAVTAAALVWASGGLTLFHILALLMVAGFGFDYAVFLRESTESGDDYPPSLRSVFVCAATTFSVFAILATSAIPSLSQIGITVALGSAVSFMMSMTFSGSRR